MVPASLTVLAICALAGAKLSVGGYLAWTHRGACRRERGGRAGADARAEDAREDAKAA
jgi:hypothetical protein